MKTSISVITLAAAILAPAICRAQDPVDYRVLATSKTSTMQKELTEAAEAGYRFVDVMGGETSFGGKEVVIVMQKITSGPARFTYRVLATTKTSTMQRELQDAANDGYEYVGQTVFESLFGGKEVAVILERDKEKPMNTKWEYRLLATKRTSTLQKELAEAGKLGYQALGMTLGETAIGGGELVVITRKEVQ
jgi:hypothetical protein